MRILLLFSLLLIGLKFTTYAQTISIDSLSSLYQSFCDSKMIGSPHYIIHFKENIEMRFLGEKEIKGVGNIQEVTKETWFSSKARTKFLRVKRMDDEIPFGIETEPETFVDEDDTDTIGEEQETFVDEDATDQIDKEPETFVDEEAEFPGGYHAMIAFIQKNLVFPKSSIEDGVEVKCFLRIVVGLNGTISDVKVTKGVTDCPECDKAAVKVIKSMPNWKPGKLNGRSVSSYCSIPINFGTQTYLDWDHEEAEFPGGYSAMKDFIDKNLIFPEAAIENGVQGQCFLRFTVSERGCILNAIVTLGVPDCPDCDKAAIKVIKSMPNWMPAREIGRCVSGPCSIAIDFEIN